MLASLGSTTALGTTTMPREMQPQPEEQDRQLEHTWTLWAHPPTSNDWSIAGYKKLVTIRTMDDAISIIEFMPDVIVKSCHLFLMKGNIVPRWEEPQNKVGGAFTYKVTDSKCYTAWKDTCYAAMGMTISRNAALVANVNGVVISPKKGFSILKVWMKDMSYQNPAEIAKDVPGLVGTSALFKHHGEQGGNA